MIYDKARRLKRELFFRIRDKYRLSTGFSMLEAVVVVGVLLALAVTGLFAYGPIVQNAKLAKLKSAASEVYTAATVYQVDGDPTTKPQDALNAWNASSTSIKVGFFDTKVIATPAMIAEEGEFVPAEGDDFCIQATDVSKPELAAKSGDCPVPVSTPSPTASATPTAPPAPEVFLLKNGDFSEGLNNWKATGLTAPVVTNGEAVLVSGSDRITTISQKVSIPAKGTTFVKYDYRLDASSHNTSNIRVNAYDSSGKFLKEVSKASFPIGPIVPQASLNVDLTEFAGKDINLELAYTNGGYFDFRNAYLDNIVLETTNEVPSAPKDVKASVDSTNMNITWSEPDSGAISVTGYTVTPMRNGVALAPISTSGNPPARTALFKGVTSGGEYTFTVTATNSIGTSAASTPSTPYNSPVQLIKNGDFSAGLNYWTASGYTMPTVVNGETVLTSGSTRIITISQAVTVPAKGITYLRHNYRLDASQYNTSNIRINVKDTTGILIKEVKNLSFPVGVAVPLNWNTVDLTEFAGRDIRLEFSYTNGNYTDVRKAYIDNVTVETVNEAPSAPTGVNITVNDTDATVKWTEPAVGTASVTGYTVTPYRNGVALPTLSTSGNPPLTSALFRGMTTGGTYTFTVTATNSIGTSGQSIASDPFLKTAKTIVNGDFSNGFTGWVVGSSARKPTVVNGEASLLAYNYDPGTIRQTVTIPNGNTKLKFNYRLLVNNYNASTLKVNIYDANGKFLKEAWKVTAPIKAGIPSTLATVDLSEFAGNDVKVEFYYETNGYQEVLNSFVDNVSVTTS